MVYKLLLIGAVVALVTCAAIYLITPGHQRRTAVRNMAVAEQTTSWTYSTAQYMVITPRPFGRLRAALHMFLYH